MYCNTSITMHLFRGITAFIFIAIAFTTQLHSIVFILLLGASFLLLRGCPMCWFVSLLTKIMNRG